MSKMARVKEKMTHVMDKLISVIDRIAEDENAKPEEIAALQALAQSVIDITAYAVIKD